MPYAPYDGEPLHFGVFIDFNNNNVFDADELVMKNSNTTNAALPTFGAATTAITKTITIPATTTEGKHRMRLVRAGNPSSFYNYVNTFDVGACINVAQYNYGSIYDFDLNVANLAVNDTAQQQESSIEIYPNPVKKHLNILNPKKDELKNVTIYSASGQVVRRRNLSNQKNMSLDVSALSKGVYFITIEMAGKQYTNKFIKE
ncbi:T9SS type A sorting domain-containing protein [Chryseobacterium terrae]|uniref:T9SS type A sorting domain-containing protein n=1 Tax=Chryseobacterium terrae TaxID=3163299 RepID=A0ABW8Y322_9FLAO